MHRLPGRDGRDGREGAKGDPGRPGKTGPKGPAGVYGKDGAKEEEVYGAHQVQKESVDKVDILGTHV